MVHKITDLISREKTELKLYENSCKLIKEGIFKYDGSMPEDCVNALYRHKVVTTKRAIEYLQSLQVEEIGTFSREMGQLLEIKNS